MMEEDDMVYSSAQIADILERTKSEEWANREWVALVDESLDDDLSSEEVDDDLSSEDGDDDWIPPDDYELDNELKLPSGVDVVSEGVSDSDSMVAPVINLKTEVVMRDSEELKPPQDVAVLQPPTKPKNVSKKSGKKKRKGLIKSILGSSGLVKEDVDGDVVGGVVLPVCVAKGCENRLKVGGRGMCPGCKKEFGVN